MFKSKRILSSWVIAPCFLFKYKWEPFVFPGSYLLGSKEKAVFSTIITIFFKMLFLSWPSPDAHSAGYFLEATGSQLPIAHLPQGIQVTAEAKFSVQYLSFARIKDVKHVNVQPLDIICSFHKCLLSVYCVPGPGLGIRGTMTTTEVALNWMPTTYLTFI